MATMADELGSEMGRLADQARRVLEEGRDRTVEWLASPQGVRFRKNAARVLIVATPLLFRHRFFRSTLTGKAIELFGGGALLIKLAEAIRDWEPQPAEQFTRNYGRHTP